MVQPHMTPHHGTISYKSYKPQSMFRRYVQYIEFKNSLQPVSLVLCVYYLHGELLTESS